MWEASAATWLGGAQSIRQVILLLPMYTVCTGIHFVSSLGDASGAGYSVANEIFKLHNSFRAATNVLTPYLQLLCNSDDGAAHPAPSRIRLLLMAMSNFGWSATASVPRYRNSSSVCDSKKVSCGGQEKLHPHRPRHLRSLVRAHVRL